MLLLSEFFFFQCIGIRKLMGLARPLNVIKSNYNFAGFICMSKRNIKSVGESYLRTFIFFDTLMTPIRAKAQDTRANPNSWETHLVRKRWDIGLLRALSPRIMMTMMMTGSGIDEDITVQLRF